MNGTRSGRIVLATLLVCCFLPISSVNAEISCDKLDDLTAEIKKITELLSQNIKLNISLEKIRLQNEKLSRINDSIESVDDDMAKLDIDRVKTSFLIKSNDNLIADENDDNKKSSLNAELISLKKDIVGYDKKEELLISKKSHLEKNKNDENSTLLQLEAALTIFERK